MECTPPISLRLDDIENTNVLGNYKNTPVIWKWDRFPVFNLGHITTERNKTFHGIYRWGFHSCGWFWMSPFVPAVKASTPSAPVNFSFQLSGASRVGLLKAFLVVTAVTAAMATIG